MPGLGGVGAPAGRPVALLGSVVLAAAVLSATAHVAARYVLGDVPFRRALLVGPVVPLVFLVVGSLHPLVALAVLLVADGVAFHLVYDVGYGTAGLVAVVHFTVSLLLALAVSQVVRLLSAAPA